MAPNMSLRMIKIDSLDPPIRYINHDLLREIRDAAIRRAWRTKDDDDYNYFIRSLPLYDEHEEHEDITAGWEWELVSP